MKEHRKKRANELNDDDYAYVSEDNSKNVNNEILDSNSNEWNKIIL